MELICEEEALIDLNKTWYTSNPTFSRCFSRTVLLIPPMLIMIFSIIASVCSTWCSGKVKRNPISRVIVCRIVILLLMLAFHITRVILEQDNDNFGKIKIADYIFYSAISAIIVLNIFIEILHQFCGTSTSAFQFVFWLTTVLCHLPTSIQDMSNIIVYGGET